MYLHSILFCTHTHIWKLPTPTAAEKRRARRARRGGLNVRRLRRKLKGSPLQKAAGHKTAEGRFEKMKKQPENDSKTNLLGIKICHFGTSMVDFSDFWGHSHFAKNIDFSMAPQNRPSAVRSASWSACLAVTCGLVTSKLLCVPIILALRSDSTV